MKKQVSGVSYQLSGAVFIILAVPLMASAAPRTFGELVHFLISYINFVIPIIISAAVLLYVYHTGQGIWRMKDGKPDEAWKQGALWGIIAITLMVSLWGILTILANTFQIPIR